VAEGGSNRVAEAVRSPRHHAGRKRCRGITPRTRAEASYNDAVPIPRHLGLALVPWALLGCSSAEHPPADPTLDPQREHTMRLQSSAFGPNEPIDPRYTCEGDDVSPPLAWTGVPEGTKSLALVVDDPDAPDPARPKRVWVHWIVLDIPPTVTALPEGASTALPAGARMGTNDWGKTAYGGPCPPIGRHRYFHKLYALDTVLGLTAPTKAALEAAMEGHVLDRAELVGTYQKTSG
jgi:Raf kinase inhibitor-like YbhB/YbcL family protein